MIMSAEPMASQRSAIVRVGSSDSIEVARGVPMDANGAATQTVGTIGAKGSGKSYLAGVYVEELVRVHCPVIVLDPVGNWPSVRLAKNGRDPGLAIAIIGGDWGDVPLGEDMGEKLGRFLVEKDGSAVIDLSELSKKKRKVFVADFCEAFYRASRQKKTPRFLVFEEAQLFAPQKSYEKGEERMIGAVTDIVRLGRNYGIGSMMVTQRPQSVSKEVLNQIECLFVGAMRGPHERKAIAEWVTEQGLDLKDPLSELPKLSPGEFFLWSPGWLKYFGKVRIGEKRTFDGSRTPTLGQKSFEGRKFKPIDLGELRALVEVEAEAEGEEPAAAAPVDDREVRELREKKRSVENENAVLRANQQALEAELSTMKGELASVLEGVAGDFEAAALRARQARSKLGTVRSARAAPAASSGVKEGLARDDAEGSHRPNYLVNDRAPRREPQARRGEASSEIVRSSPTPSRSYGGSLLAAIAAYGPLTRIQLSLFTGKSLKSSTFAMAIKSLADEGEIEDGGGMLTATAHGAARAGNPRLPKGRALYDHWKGRLTSYDRDIFVVVAEGPKEGITRTQIADRTGKSLKSSSFAGSIARLKGYRLLEDRSGKVAMRLDARKMMGLDG